MLLRGQHYEAGRIVALIHVLYIILEHVSFNIISCIKSDVITLGGFGDIDCIYMDKWALRGHFYSYVDLVWLLNNIGTGCHEIAQVVFWVELHVQRRLCPIFVKSLVPGKGDSMVWCQGYPTSTNLPWVDELSTDPWDLWCHSMVSKHRYTTTWSLRDIGLGHGYCCEIYTSVIAWCLSLGS